MSRGGARKGAGRKPSPKQTKPLGIRCDERTAERLRERATQEGVTLGQLIEQMLTMYDKREAL